MALQLYLARTELERQREETNKNFDETIKKIDEAYKRLFPGINLSEIMAKRGINFRARKHLEDLINRGAIAPNDKWVWLNSMDGYAARLYRSGLVERRKIEHSYEYRIKEIDLVKELLAYKSS